MSMQVMSKTELRGTRLLCATKIMSIWLWTSVIYMYKIYRIISRFDWLRSWVVNAIIPKNSHSCMTHISFSVYKPNFILHVATHRCKHLIKLIIFTQCCSHTVTAGNTATYKKHIHADALVGLASNINAGLYQHMHAFQVQQLSYNHYSWDTTM